MTIAQKRNASMQQLNSADLLAVENKNFAAEWYDGVGNAVFSSTITVNIDTEKINTAPSVYSLVSDVLTITEAGVYSFNFCVTASHSSGSADAVIAAWLEEDPDTGSYAMVPATIVYTAAHGVGYVTAVNSSIIRVGINYNYRLRVARSSGSDNMITSALQSKISVTRLFKNG